MKNLFPISIFAISTLILNSCVSISNTPDDDVYVVKSSQIPVGESLDDETNYSAYKYKKDRNNNNITYNAGGGMNNFDPFFMQGIGYRPQPFGYNPYQMYGSNWAYYPGYGWSYMNPYFGNPFYGGYGNYYNYYNHGYYSSFYNNNYYGNNYGWNNNGWNNNNNNWNNNNNNGGGSGGSNPYHHSGPRGSNGGGGVITRSNIPGTLKSTTSPLSSAHSVGSGTIVKPVGKEPIINRNSSSTQTQVLSRTNENIDYNRPGRIQGGSVNNSGSISRGNTSGSSSRGGNVFSGIENNSGSSSSSRGSSGSNGSISTPSRTSGEGGSIGSSSRTGGGSTGGGGGSTSRPSSGSTGGGRR
jgi:hypothetical protein